MLQINRRMRRIRSSEMVRDLVTENHLSTKDLILPVFIREGQGIQEEIKSMPGIYRRSLDLFIPYAKSIQQLGIRAIALFPLVPENKKNSTGDECFNPEGLIHRAIKLLKAEIPQLLVITDIALDPYNSDGHDGVVDADGEIINDQTVEILCKQAVSQARAGSDIVAPSDMMDGRIQAIRNALDDAGFQKVLIMAYSAKYASAFYGPFRDALDSAPKAGDKKTYQMNPANSREAMLEIQLDIEEGADIIMVKPGMPYLDIVFRAKNEFDVPVAAYQVSGEYAMITAAAQNGWLDRPKVILESLLAFKRAGADMILTYFAEEAAKLLNQK